MERREGVEHPDILAMILLLAPVPDVTKLASWFLQLFFSSWRCSSILLVKPHCGVRVCIGSKSLVTEEVVLNTLQAFNGTEKGKTLLGHSPYHYPNSTC